MVKILVPLVLLQLQEAVERLGILTYQMVQMAQTVALAAAGHKPTHLHTQLV